jgi:hypothetical protein
MVKLTKISKYLSEVANNCSQLQLCYDPKDKYFSIPLYFHGVEGYYLFFDPWIGLELKNVYDHEFVESHEESIKTEGKLWKKHRWTCFWENSKLHEKELDEFLDEFGPVDSQNGRNYWDYNIGQCRDEHVRNGFCHEISRFLKNGDEEYMIPIIYVPDIYSYAILNKKECGGFEPINYCPFCGAKFFVQCPDDISIEMSQLKYNLDCGDYGSRLPDWYGNEWIRELKSEGQYIYGFDRMPTLNGGYLEKYRKIKNNWWKACAKCNAETLIEIPESTFKLIKRSPIKW